MQESKIEKDLLKKYQIGHEVGCVLGQTWSHSGRRRSTTDNPGRLSKFLDLSQLERRFGLNREQLLARFRLYRTWSPDRFRFLISLRRENGSPLVSFRTLQILQANKLSPKDRRRLEADLVRSRMSSAEFFSLVRRTVNGHSDPQPRLVSNRALAFRRFESTARQLLERFALLDHVMAAADHWIEDHGRGENTRMILRELVQQAQARLESFPESRSDGDCRTSKKLRSRSRFGRK